MYATCNFGNQRTTARAFFFALLAIGTLIVIFAVLASLLRQCGGSFDAFCAAKGVFRL